MNGAAKVPTTAELQPWTYGKVWTVMALCFAIGICVGAWRCVVSDRAWPKDALLRDRADAVTDSTPASAARPFGMNGYCVRAGCLRDATASDGLCNHHGHRVKAARPSPFWEAHTLDPKLYGPLRTNPNCPYCLPETP